MEMLVLFSPRLLPFAQRAMPHYITKGMPTKFFNYGSALSNAHRNAGVFSGLYEFRQKKVIQQWDQVKQAAMTDTWFEVKPTFASVDLGRISETIVFPVSFSMAYDLNLSN